MSRESVRILDRLAVHPSEPAGIAMRGQWRSPVPGTDAGTRTGG